MSFIDDFGWIWAALYDDDADDVEYQPESPGESEASESSGQMAPDPTAAG